MSAAMGHEALLERMSVLRRAFVHQVPERLRQLDAALAGGGDGKEEPISVAERVVHSLRGSAATFGYHELGAAAWCLEKLLREAKQSGARGAVGAHEKVSSARTELQSIADAIDPSERTPTILKMQSVTTLAPPQVDEVWLVLDVDDVFSHQLGAFATDWRQFPTVSSAKQALLVSRPNALVADLDSAGVTPLVIAARNSGVPVVGLSQRNDFEARLDAVRAGVRAYLTRPLDAARVIEQVDRVVEVRSESPPRVLLVDDDRDGAMLHGAMLEAEGISVRVATNPMTVFQELEELAPDIVLVDLYMPGCNGIELASVLRQEEAWVGLPIMFLSAEQDVDKHLVAMGKGADDFLTKPITAHRLVAQVRARVARARVMRGLMHNDSLTGLLNHISFKERLASEVSRAWREKQPVAVAMLDLDKFKSINDSFGHPAGDRVLRTLARVLRQRLRKSDGIGRYGGEEFAVVLPNANAEAAMRLVDELRRTFSTITHNTGARTFSATFSAGVAVLSPDDANQRDHDRLIAAADSALYEAKRGGRDCVKLAEDPVRDKKER